MNNGSFNKIIWAVNPFESATEVIKNLSGILNQISERTDASVEPVTVVSPDQLGLPKSFTENGLGHFRSLVQREIEFFLKENPVKRLLAPQIIELAQSNTRKAVEALQKYARDSKADLIAVGTHGRRGLPRLFLGSFAETMILNAQTPLLTVGPLTNDPEKMERPIQRILFPTDFNQPSQMMLNNLITFSRKLGASISVFHAVPYLWSPAVQSGVAALGGGWVDPTTYLLEMEKDLRQRAEGWVNTIEKAGVPAQSLVVAGTTSVTEAILSHAHEMNADLIAMAAQTGPIESALIGSIGRQIARSSHCPVWFMRPMT